MLCSVLAAAFFIGQPATVVLFGLIAFWALREFITLTPTRPGDHRTLFWVFFVITPLQFVLVGMDSTRLYSIVIPGLRLPLHPRADRHGRRLQAVSGADGEDPGRPADLRLLPELRPGPVDAATARERRADPGANTRLLFFFVLIVQLSDALQYAWAQIPSRHVIAPTINPTKTWEGLLGGTASVTLIGAVLWWATPFQASWWMAAAMSLVISADGLRRRTDALGHQARPRRASDYGTLVEGHGGVLDRIDSICFAAPVFFHFTLYWLMWHS